MVGIGGEEGEGESEDEGIGTENDAGLYALEFTKAPAEVLLYPSTRFSPRTSLRFYVYLKVLALYSLVPFARINSLGRVGRMNMRRAY